MRRRLLFVAAALLLAVNAAMAQAAKTAYAVYCEEDETLYFLNSSETLSDGGDYNGLTITKAWPVDLTKKFEHEWFERNTSYRRVVFDTSFKEVKPTNFSFWFAGSEYLSSVEGLKNLNTSEADEMQGMFEGCKKLTELDLSSFNTKWVTTMYAMFRDCKALTELDLSSFNTEYVIDMSQMFSGCDNLTYIAKSDEFVIGGNTKTDDMYDGCDPLLQGSTPYVVYKEADKSLHFLCDAAADLTAITLEDGTEITLTEGNYWKGSDFVNIYQSQYPKWHSKGTDVTKVVFESSFKFARPTNCTNWFASFQKLEAITGLDNLHTSKVTDMYGMFRECYSLKSLAFGENFNTANVTDMNNMFSLCTGLTALDVSKFNTAKVKDMANMFKECGQLTSDKFKLGSFNTAKVEDMSMMFNGCASLLTLDLSSFNTAEVNTMEGMFSGCLSLTSIVFGEHFKASNTYNMASMFSKCYTLSTLDLSGFNTYDVMHMNEMFSECSGLKSLDLSSFDLTRAWDISKMFYNCTKLETIKIGDKSKTGNNLNRLDDMFYGCRKLTSLDLSGIKTSASMVYSPMFLDCDALTDLNISNFYISNDISNELAQCDKLMKLDLSNATGNVNLLADNTAFDGRGMLIRVPESYDGDISAENYIVKPGRISFARTFTSGNMSTICLPYAIDAESLEGQGTLYKYVGIDGNEVKFTSVTGETTRGEAYLFKPETGEEIIFSSIKPITDLPEEIAEGAAPGLYGTYNGKTFADEAAKGIYFGWAGGSFWRAGEGAEVKHNRAYLKAAAGTTPARLNVKLDSGVTGISEVSTAANDDNASAYDLMGRRVNAGYKGIVIKNGKKVKP